MPDKKYINWEETVLIPYQCSSSSTSTWHCKYFAENLLSVDSISYWKLLKLALYYSRRETSTLFYFYLGRKIVKHLQRKLTTPGCLTLKSIFVLTGRWCRGCGGLKLFPRGALGCLASPCINLRRACIWKRKKLSKARFKRTHLFIRKQVYIEFRIKVSPNVLLSLFSSRRYFYEKTATNCLGFFPTNQRTCAVR